MDSLAIRSSWLLGMETRPTRPTIDVGLKMEESNLRDVMANVEAAKEKTVKEVMMDFIFD